MPSYRLVLPAEGDLAERSGYVFCADDKAACAAARALLNSHPQHSRALAWDGDRLVCEEER